MKFQTYTFISRIDARLEATETFLEKMEARIENGLEQGKPKIGLA
jgi:hypothetical protein